MKLKKETKRYCPHCKQHTQQKVAEARGKERGSLKKGSLQRAYKRGRGRGFGNVGKYGSKPPLTKWKRTGAKTSKKTNLKFTCLVCKKTTIQKQGVRTRKLVLEQ